MIRRLLVASLCGLGVSAQADPAPAKAPAPPPKIDLAVLYVGSEGGNRTADFTAFLGEHFREVGTAVYPTFEAPQADAYDVVILDVEMKPSERSIGIGPQPELPADYARATVLVNGPGVIVADRQLASKIDWL